MSHWKIEFQCIWNHLDNVEAWYSSKKFGLTYKFTINGADIDDC
jgi:hypothetical protein